VENNQPIIWKYGGNLKKFNQEEPFLSVFLETTTRIKLWKKDSLLQQPKKAAQ